MNFVGQEWNGYKWREEGIGPLGKDAGPIKAPGRPASSITFMGGWKPPFFPGLFC